MKYKQKARALALKDSANRWANIIISIVYAGLWIIDMMEEGVLMAQYLINISMVVVAVLIVWYSYKWPKQEA